MSSAKVIKIYRHKESRLGFVCNDMDIPCGSIDKSCLLQFIRSLNKLFLSCENDKNMSLFAIDQADEDFVFLLSLALVAPLITYVLFGHAELIIPWYCGVIILLAYKVTVYLAELNRRKRQFEKGEQKLWESFAEQQQLFRKTFCHLQINYFESESQGYFQIRSAESKEMPTESQSTEWRNLQGRQKSTE